MRSKHSIKVLILHISVEGLFNLAMESKGKLLNDFITGYFKKL